MQRFKIAKIFAVLMYSLLLLITFVACWEVIVAEVPFHLIMFSGFIIVNSLGIIYALKQDIVIELRILSVSLFYKLFTLLFSNIFLIGRTESTFWLGWLVIELQIILSLSYRYVSLNFFKKEIELLKREGKI